jgi:phage virion morphogenesis protein
MTGVTMQLLDRDGALAELDGYERRARDPRGMYENIGAALVTSTQHRFDTSTAPDGTIWPPSLRVIASGGQTLKLSARLMRSITYIASMTGVEIGTNVIYAAIHQFGGTIRQAARTAILHFKTNKRTGASRFAKPGKADRAQKAAIGARVINMPARPYIGMDEDDPRTVINAAESWLAGEAVPQ